MKKICGIVATMVLLLTGCSKPQDAIVPTDMSTWDKELAPQIQKLSKEDKELFASYAMRLKVAEGFGGTGIPMGTTVGQAIEQQKAWGAEQEKKRAEEAALRDKLEKERAAARAAIDGAVTVTLLEKKQLPRDWEVRRISDTQVFRIGVHNKGEKEVAGVAGSIEFIDIFDKPFGAVSFSITENIKPGGEYVWTGSRDYNQFVADHKAVWNAETGKFKTRFVPKAVVYSDGSKLLAEE